MDVEKAMEFILERQAEAAAWQAESAAWQAKSAAWQAKTDKRITAITKLIQTGMKMLVKMESRADTLDKSLKELAEAQKKTEKNLNLFLESWKRGTNGNKRS